MSEINPPDPEVFQPETAEAEPADATAAAPAPAPAPAQAEIPVPPPVKLTPEMIRHAFRQAARPYPDPPSGSLTATLVTLVPVVYFLIIAGLLYCVIILGFKTKPELNEEGLPSLRGFIAWFAPILAGLAMLYYMIKPLFGRRSGNPEEQELSRIDQPLLFTFIEQVVRAGKVPAPSIVMVDCDTTVRASLVPTGRGREKSLNLTIGLTALYAYNTRKLAAAICSELGKFDENSGAAYRVQQIAGWLQRVVAYRDAFDETLDEFSEKQSKIIRTFGIFLRWMVKLVRGLLDGMLSAVSSLGRDAIRQQQFRADYAAAQLSGPIDFNALLMQVFPLQVTQGIAQRNLKRMINDSLPANFSEFVANSEDNIPDEVWQPFEEQMVREERKRVTLGATRRERMANLTNLDRVPLLNLDVPAASLLTNFEDTAQQVSVLHYRNIYGEEYRKAWLRPNAEFLYELGYSAYRPDSRDTMIDYNEGDKWYKWRKLASTVGGFLLTLGLVLQAGKQIAKASESDETKFRRNIGREVMVRGGAFREIVDVKYAREGEVVTHESDGETEIAVRAPSTGWYYDTGEGVIVPCKKGIFVDAQALEDQESPDMKLVLEQLQMNEENETKSEGSSSDDSSE